MRSIIVLFIAFVAAAHALSISYSGSGNISASATKDHGLSWRSTGLLDLDVLSLTLNTQYHSFATQIHNNTASIDLVYGALAIPQAQLPYTFIAAFSGTTSWSFGNSLLTASASASAAYIASAYIGLQEKNSTGSVINTFLFRQTPLLKNNFVWSRSASSGGSNGLTYAQFTGSPGSDSTWNVSLTFIASDVVGKINYADAVVGPKSVETVVAINGYPYQASTNTLSLVMAVATGQASASAAGSATSLTSGSGDSEVYFSLSNTHLNGAEVHPVQVSAFTAGDYDSDIGNNYFQAQVQGKYNAQASLQKVTATFAAGASNIVYDPAMGAGTNPQQLSSSAFALAPAVALLAVVVMGLLF